MCAALGQHRYPGIAQANMRFTPALRKLLLGGIPLALEDMLQADPLLYENKFRYLLESRYKETSPPMVIEDLCLTFRECL